MKHESHSQALCTWWFSTQLCLVCHVTPGKDTPSGWASGHSSQSMCLGWGLVHSGLLNCMESGFTEFSDSSTRVFKVSLLHLEVKSQGRRKGGGGGPVEKEEASSSWAPQSASNQTLKDSRTMCLGNFNLKYPIAFPRQF